MQTWDEILIILISVDIGVVLGLLTQKLKKGLWLIGYILPLVLIIIIALTRHFLWLSLYPPFSWVCFGRREFVIFAFTIPMIFGTLIPRLQVFRQKVILFLFVTIASIIFFIVPFISPILVREELENIETEFSNDGVCIQATDYTCGPAAAVTALSQFGILADEGELAINAYTTPQTGTSDDLLAAAIEKLYGNYGIICKYHYFKSIDELKNNCPVIVVTKYSFLIDHYVTVLKIKKNKVIIANPASGREILTYDEFEKIWHSVGIIVKQEI